MAEIGLSDKVIIEEVGKKCAIKVFVPITR